VTDASPPERRSPRRGDLLTLMAADLPGCELHRRSDAEAVATVDGAPRFAVQVRTDKRKLLTLRALVVVVPGPQTELTAGRIELRHTGQLRRTGLEARIRDGDVLPVRSLRDHLLADGELAEASHELDFTRFVVEVADGRWRAGIELMGASHVRTTLPPSSRYVKLPADQVRPLVRTVAVLRRRLPADDAALTLPAPAVPDPRHLPGSAP
jgi:hypothetical protein